MSVVKKATGAALALATAGLAVVPCMDRQTICPQARVTVPVVRRIHRAGEAELSLV